MPAPPFPSLDSDPLWMILKHSMGEYEEDMVDVRGAALHAAVHGWFEGHLDGEHGGMARPSASRCRSLVV